jgi:pyridoxamine 5'-phosphate oxidase
MHREGKSRKTPAAIDRISMGQKKKRPLEPSLLETTVHENPVRQLEAWLREARRTGLREPAAMSLATATRDGQPSIRVVLLKSFDDEGLVFFTNYESRKGKEIEENPRASVLFFWDSLARQVRVEGTIARISSEESAVYFRSRPRLSRLSAWASKQSSVVSDRLFLEKEVARFSTQFADGEIPLPPFWGGYRLVPDVFEFWQGRKNRLHDRLRFTRSGETWNLDRLAP